MVNLSHYEGLAEAIEDAFKTTDTIEMWRVGEDGVYYRRVYSNPEKYGHWIFAKYSPPTFADALPDLKSTKGTMDEKVFTKIDV